MMLLFNRTICNNCLVIIYSFKISELFVWDNMQCLFKLYSCIVKVTHTTNVFDRAATSIIDKKYQIYFSSIFYENKVTKSLHSTCTLENLILNNLYINLYMICVPFVLE